MGCKVVTKSVFNTEYHFSTHTFFLASNCISQQLKKLEVTSEARARLHLSRFFSRDIIKSFPERVFSQNCFRCLIKKCCCIWTLWLKHREKSVHHGSLAVVSGCTFVDLLPGARASETVQNCAVFPPL